jgi:parvulin-like peptidyl-prolyl isomerase
MPEIAPRALLAGLTVVLLATLSARLHAAEASTARREGVEATTSTTSPHAADTSPAASSGAARPFARVGDTVISSADYQRALAVAMRKKYYHAKPPESEYAQFQRDVGDDMVNRVLLMAEARRRGIVPDQEKIKATVAGYDAQYKGSANWQANRDRMLANVVPQLEADSRLERLEKLVRQVPEPPEAEVRQFYERNRTLFVEPEQVQLSVILLKVDPSSRQAAWNGAMDEGRALHKRLLAGADFGELARLHSGDRSAARGGQMDYTHRGMLPEAVHGIVDKLQPGQISASRCSCWKAWPSCGWTGAARRSSAASSRCASALPGCGSAKRPKSAGRRSSPQLRQAAPIRIDESQYVPLRGTTDRPRSS